MGERGKLVQLVATTDVRGRPLLLRAWADGTVEMWLEDRRKWMSVEVATTAD